MGLVRKTLGSVSAALTKVNGDGEGCGSRGDVDRGSTSKVETAEDERPTVGVPGPAGDWVVDDCGPDEHKGKERAKATAFGNCTDCDCATEGNTT